MRFINLTVLDYFGAGGEDVYQAETAMTYVNAERILWFAAAERGTQVWMEGGEEFLVRESVDDIFEILERSLAGLQGG